MRICKSRAPGSSNRSGSTPPSASTRIRSSPEANRETAACGDGEPPRARWAAPVSPRPIIDGRELNLSLLAGENGPEVLPPAEIRFDAYPPGKVRVVGYRSKWEEGSFEFNNTPRSFEFPAADASLIARVERTCTPVLAILQPPRLCQGRLPRRPGGPPLDSRGEREPLSLAGRGLLRGDAAGGPVVPGRASADHPRHPPVTGLRQVAWDIPEDDGLC